MERPAVRQGEWITIKSSSSDRTGVAGHVFDVFDDGLGVGYLQNGMKAIKEDVIWKGDHWSFRSSGPNGSYLRGPEEAIVKRGPPR
jgi:hypothetical protein